MTEPDAAARPPAGLPLSAGSPAELPSTPAPPALPPAAPAHPGRRYVYAWLALVVLTALSFGVDRLQLGSLSTALSLAVALVKASVVFVVFMHLDREPFPIRFVAALNVGWVLLLCLGIAADIGQLTAAARGGPEPLARQPGAGSAERP